MQQNETLPGILPTARVFLEVLLGPAAEIVQVAVQVEDPGGRLLGLRTWPEPKVGTESATLDAAWRTLLLALPHETLMASARLRNRSYHRDPG